MWLNKDNLQIGKIAVPLGVIGMIYEARPNVTADAAALCLKSGNAVMLRGSGDAIESNKKIAAVLSSAAERAGIPHGAIQLIEDTTRETANEMMRLNEYLDVLIPRGGAGLIRACVENATVPCIQTGTGICHVNVDEFADIEKALKIIENAKTSDQFVYQLFDDAELIFEYPVKYQCNCSFEKTNKFHRIYRKIIDKSNKK